MNFAKKKKNSFKNDHKQNKQHFKKIRIKFERL